MILLPLVCTVSTDIAELRERYGDALQHACGPGIKAVSIMGDHERVVYTIQYAQDWKGQPVFRVAIPGHLSTPAAAVSARVSAQIFRSTYQAKSFSYEVRDGKGRPVCLTEVEEDESSKTVCVWVVGDDEKEPEGSVS